MIDTSSGSTTAAVGFTALAVMGAYLCRHRLFCPEPPRSIVDEDDDNEERTPMVKTPVEPPQARRRLRFGDPIQHESPIPRLCDTPRWERERVYWQAHEYAQIRDNQRRLIETVLRSARQCGDGELPPPIPGESRRGLGLICEPGTNSGRAARVRSARRAVVEAQRDGYSPAQLADLAEELGAWATNNAREMGLKDAEAVGDFDFRSFSREIQSQNEIDSPPSSPKATAPIALKRRISLPKEPAASSPQSPSVIAHAQRHGTEKTAPVAHARRSSESSQQPEEDQADGLGLASMIRNDSLTNLVEYGTEEAPQQTQEAPDGAGLASMIRNDSLGDLQAMGNTSENYFLHVARGTSGGSASSISRGAAGRSSPSLTRRAPPFRRPTPRRPPWSDTHGTAAAARARSPIE